MPGLPSEGMKKGVSHIGWAVVQHHKVDEEDNKAFAHAVELVGVVKKKEKKDLDKVGGVFFEDYGPADRYVYRENFPDPDYHGTRMLARGDFSKLVIQGKRIYLPEAA